MTTKIREVFTGLDLTKWFLTPHSSSIKAFSYNKKDRKLTVHFVSDNIYSYEKVPEKLVTDMVLAQLTKKSVGNLFYRTIRDKFIFTKIQ